MHLDTIRFLLIAPVVGALGFVATDQLLTVFGLIHSALAQPTAPSAIFATVPILWLYGLVLAYPIGALPALLCYLLYSLVLRGRGRVSRLVRGIVSAGIGLGVSAAFGSIFLYSSTTGLLGLIPWAMAGFLGGGVAAIAGSEDYTMQHNPSIKRDAALSHTAPYIKR